MPPGLTLRPPTRRLLSLFFAAMILLHGFFFWHSRRNVSIGRADFVSFYTAARIVHQGNGRQLYNLREQESVQRSVAPEGFAERGALLPYNHPAFEVWVFLPLARLSCLRAYLAWFATNCGLLSAVIFLLRRNLPLLGKEPLTLWIMAALSLTPIFIALVQGQDSILLLLCASLAFVALQRRRHFRAGLSLGLGLFKFQFALPILIPFLFLRRWKLAAGFCCAAAVLVLMGVGMTGWQASLKYPQFLWAMNHDVKLNSLVGSQRTLNLNGLISSLIPMPHSLLRMVAILVSSVVVVTMVALFWAKVRHSESEYFHLAFAASMVMAVLVSYHSWLHDLSILFPALALAAEVLLSQWNAIRYRSLLLVSMAALFFAPMYFLQLLRFGGIPIVELVMLIFLFGILTQKLSAATN